MAGMEKRRFPRYPIIVEVYYSSDSPPILARMTDMSEGGIFIDTMNPLEARSTVWFKFHLSQDKSDNPIAGYGQVAWNQYSVGMGIEFTRLSPEDRLKIKSFLETQS